MSYLMIKKALSAADSAALLGHQEMAKAFRNIAQTIDDAGELPLEKPSTRPEHIIKT